jgi:hypothetical protein
MKKITEEMIAIAMEDGWSEDNAKRGYAIFTGTLGNGAEHIEKIDSIDVFESDKEAAEQAERDGIKIIHDITFDESNIGYYIDTPKNRQLLKELGYESNNDRLKELRSLCVESSYNENTDSELNYYIKEPPTIGDIAWLYAKEYDTIQKMRIKQVICRSDDVKAYDTSSEDVLTDGESKYDADTSAEFITDNDSYLVWFDYM